MLILLGSMGDMEMTWEEHNDAEMRRTIANLMKRGVTFFALRDGVPRHQARKKISSIGQMPKDARAVCIPDADILKMFEEGKVDLQRSVEPVMTAKVERDPSKVATGRHAAVPPMEGG